MTSDTTPDAQEQFDALLRSRSGSDRVVMACEMFDLARALLATRIKEAEPSSRRTEFEVRILQRMYGDDFDAEMRRAPSADGSHLRCEFFPASV